MSDLTNNEYSLIVNKSNLARLEESDCTDHERLVIARSIIQTGGSYTTAAKATGVSIHNIYRAVAEKMPRDAKEELLEELALDITIQASLAIQERIEDGAIKSSELVKAMQVARDTVARKRRWDKDPDVVEEKTRSKLEELLEGLSGKVMPPGTVTVMEEERDD